MMAIQTTRHLIPLRYRTCLRFETLYFQMSHFDEDEKREASLSISLAEDNKQLTLKDLVVLVQLFYLPNEHGQVRHCFSV